MAPPRSELEQQLEDRLVLLDRLRQDERMAVTSRVASMIGHLIGTPLNVIAGRAAMIRSNPNDESAVENARRIEEQVDRLAQQIRRLIEYLTAPDPAVESRSVAEMLEDALGLYRPLAERRGVRLNEPSAALPEGTIDSTALMVLTSLLSLSLRLTPAGGEVSIGVTQAETGVVFDLRVPAMHPTPQRLDRLDPPEHKTARVGADQLQVLSVCHAIARRAEGRLEAQALQPTGTLLRFSCKAS
jgi:two-component system, NtrC family, sensor kinase